MIKRLVAVAFIFACCSVAWMILGGTGVHRTETSCASYQGAVGEMWGGPQVQHAPTAVRPGTRTRAVTPHEPTGNPDGSFRNVVETVEETTRAPVLLVSSDLSADIRVHYGSQGVSTWRCALVGESRPSERSEIEGFETAPSGGVHTARDIALTVTTDFADIDFPEGTLSPTSNKRTDSGWRLARDHGTLVTSADLGDAMPQKINPGPWVSRVTFFAPFSLFLFIFAVFVLSILRGDRLHPMHYVFLGAACFAFHLLLAFLVDHVTVGAAMLIASVVSVGLVVSNVRLVAGARFAVVEVGGAQFVYLVALAATFFLEGFAGLAVTLLSVATLFVVTQVTGGLDWDAVLTKP